MPTLAELIQQGEARGKATGKADALLAVLRARGLLVSDAERARVFACTDLAMLDRWIERAAIATATREVFAEEQ